MVKKVVSHKFSDIIAFLVQSLPFTLPHFKNSEAFLSNIAASQLIELSVSTTTFNILLSETRLNFLTLTKVVKAANVPNAVMQ